jgi:hypothetical protein
MIALGMDMPIRHRLAFTVALISLTAVQSSLSPQERTAGGGKRAALISELTGTASVRLHASAKPLEVARFAAIPEAAILQVGAGSRAVLVLAGGSRFALGGGARATVHADRLTSTSGSIDQLPALPALPQLVALDDSAPRALGGVRLRTTVIGGISPANGSAIASATVLRFNAVPGAATYRVEIEDNKGRVIFEAQAMSPQVQVPPDVLEAGASYYWTVRTLDRQGAQARGSADFRTLSTEEVRKREELRRTLQAGGDASSLALLAAIDQHLGLHHDALQGFRAALVRSPGDEALEKAIRQLEAMLETDGR